jgi:hypothetical protein
MGRKPSGSILIEALMKELDCANQRQLAIKLGVLSPQIASWSRRSLSRTTAKNIVRRLEERFVRNSFSRICEFRKLEPLQEGKANSLKNRIRSREVCETLKNAKGIYSFYDSSGRLIYIGKTERNHLLGEMGQQFSKRKVSIKRTNRKGQFVHMKVPLRDFVEYCSAYSVHPTVIREFEALIARLAPNDIVNSQIPRYRL